MANQNQQNQESNPEHASFYDQADGKFEKAIEKEGEKLSKRVKADEEEKEESYSKYMNRAEGEVRANEDASLQDGSYSFDEANTDNDDFHDIDIDYDNDEDFIGT